MRKFAKNVGFSEHSNSEKNGIKISIASLLYKPKYIERHFTILNKSKTKDGPVSLDPNELSFLIKISKRPMDEIKSYVKKNIPEFEKMKGFETRKLSDDELLNRDYYRGRFASLNKDNKFIYNWEEKIIN